MIDFCMPSLGADMDAGTLVEWKVEPGDRVARGEIVAVVETQKAAIEVEIFHAGVIAEILVPEGAKVPVGTVLARVRPEVASGDDAGTSAAAQPRLRISPAARKRARDRDVDVRQVVGTGPGGAITLADIDAAAVIGAGGAAVSSTDRQAGLRAAIAAAMSRSKREIPHYYLQKAIDMHAAAAWLEARNRDRPAAARVLPAALLVAAVARALGRFPELNGHFVDGTYRSSEAVHVGMAVALRGGGVVAPTLRAADQRSVDDLMATLLDVVRRARAGSLRSSELSDATITITSLGERGPDAVYGVIIPPQVAMVGFGAIARRPWVVSDGVVARPVVTATLSADHRVSDGHRGGLFLAAVDRLLQTPGAL